MSAEIDVIFGPPGTGKTKELTDLTQQYARDEGSDTLLLCAFTRTAAQELAGRVEGLEKRQAGTLHALCFHGLGRPALAEAHCQEWNETYPLYAISPGQSITDYDLGESPTRYGDQCLNELNVARHRLQPLKSCSGPAQDFWRLWWAWKKAQEYYDYTDLIHHAYTLLPVAPSVSQPYTLMVDEAQDMSLLQWRLLSQWAQHAKRFIVAGDDEQALYRWCGADFSPLLTATSRRVLPQSYRLPQSHQALALSYGQHIQTREVKHWQPRAEEGKIIPSGQGWQQAEAWAAYARAWLETAPAETSLTFLASCSYMLQPLVHALLRQGIPFGNRWRRKRHDWNPLLPPQRGMGMVQGLLDFLKEPARLWTWAELSSWVPMLHVAQTLQPRARALLAARGDEPGICPMDTLTLLFRPDALQGALTTRLDWLEAHTIHAQKKALAYPCAVYRAYGRQALTDEPRLRLGTAHSFKGCESDTVVYFTDLSRSQHLARCAGGEGADDVWRMRYVAATRARDTLILAGPPVL